MGVAPVVFTVRVTALPGAAAGTTEVGANTAVAPAGSPCAVKATDAENPFVPVAVRGNAAAPPANTLCVGAVAVNVKVPAGGGVVGRSTTGE